MATVTIKKLVTPASHWTQNYSVTVRWNKDETVQGTFADPANGWPVKTLRDGSKKLYVINCGYNKDTPQETKNWVEKFSNTAVSELVIV